MNKMQITTKTKKRIKIAAISVFVLIIILLSALLLFRNYIFRSILDGRIATLRTEKQGELTVKKAAFKGLTGIELEGISLKPLAGDTLLAISKIRVEPAFWPLLAFKLRINSLKIDGLSIHAVVKDSLTNYDFLLKNTREDKTDDSEESSGRVGYHQKIAALFNRLISAVPEQLDLKKCEITYNKNGYPLSFKTDSLTFKQGFYNSYLEVLENGESCRWLVKGRVEKDKKKISFNLLSGDKRQVVAPWLLNNKNLYCGFDSLKFSFALLAENDEQITLNGNSEIHKLVFKNPRIADEDVIFEKSKLNYLARVGKNYFELDSLTTATVNHLNFRPYFYLAIDSTWQIKAKILRTTFPAQAFFQSLPSGLFTHVHSVKASGNLEYHFNFSLDAALPDSLKLESELKKQDFRLLASGNLDLFKMSSPFTYTAYEQGQPVRDFVVGPENGNFKTVDQIPQILKNAVLLSEDFGFFWHRGFIPDAFRNAAITNFKHKKFVRGGSTITMQLVKNVFLTRKKTVARKIEELLIVWLIENNYITSKERMFEVYLNIIEWGPLVYGANEASRFYFNKDIEKISLAEAIYLASIIPRPKRFYTSFDESGNLRDWTNGYFKLISGKMLSKNMITEDEYLALDPVITLKGAAKKYIERMAGAPEFPLDEDEEVITPLGE